MDADTNPRRGRQGKGSTQGGAKREESQKKRNDLGGLEFNEGERHGSVPGTTVWGSGGLSRAPQSGLKIIRNCQRRPSDHPGDVEVSSWGREGWLGTLIRTYQG